MKNLIQTFILSFALSSLMFQDSARAEKMSSETQDMVIARMESVLSTLDKQDPSWAPSQQRLADLLAERARTRFMAEVENNCNGCKGSTQDRLQAIKIYEDLLKTVALNKNATILFQLAHLYDMANQTNKAISLFEQILKEAKSKQTSAEIVARSHSGLGDLLFSTGKSKEALTHYTEALKYNDVPSRGLIIYNMAWCHLNLNRVDQGIKTLETLVRDPKLITRESSDGPQYDVVFHTDILRDLATFYARRNITQKEISSFEEFSPKEKRKELLLHFASEADRLGQKRAARIIYSRYLEDTSLTPEERLSAVIKLVQVNYDAGMTAESTAEFSRAADAFQKICPDPSKCQDLETTMKRYVTELHRSKKLAPDMDLLNSYVVYSRAFPNDIEMARRGAAVADSMKKYALAVVFLRAATDNPTSSTEDKQKSLAAEISAAEKSNDIKLQKAAYDHYLATFPTGEKRFEVQYQVAYLDYQQKKFRDSAIAFNAIAKLKEAPLDLRKKSADLSLDCLVQMTYEETLEDWAWEYAALFPQASVEYKTIARKALANRAAKIANNSQVASAQLKNVLGQLQTANMQQASSSEKEIYLNNIVVISRRLDDDQSYLSGLVATLKLTTISSEKREETLSRLVGYYEKKLDFQNAYLTAKKMAFKKLSSKEKQLRLGTLADLAGIDPTTHYRKALMDGLSGSAAMSLRHRLVVLSKNPVTELKKQAPHLRKNPELLNESVLFAFAKTHDKKGLKSILAMKELSRQSAPLFIAKQDFYDELLLFKKRIKTHRLVGTTDRLLQKTIKERIKLLKQADQLLAKSLRYKDITAQLLSLDIVANENDRMVRDIVGLPVPKGLTAQEQGQYLEALKHQSKPYFAKAKMAQQKGSEIWSESRALSRLVTDYSQARPEIKSLLRREMQLLLSLSNEGRLAAQISAALNEGSMSKTDLDSARKNVAQRPNDVREIENLKILETKIGHPLMPTYLDARLSQIQKGRSL